MSIEHYKRIFKQYNGMMRTKELQQENIYYQKIQQLIQDGYKADKRNHFHSIRNEHPRLRH